MDVETAARAWVQAWEHGWATGDAEVIDALYAADAVFRSHPFREPERSAGEYARRAFSDEELAEVRFGEPVVTGDRAAVEYYCSRPTVRKPSQVSPYCASGQTAS